MHDCSQVIANINSGNCAACFVNAGSCWGNCSPVYRVYANVHSYPTTHQNCVQGNIMKLAVNVGIE